MIFLIEYDRSQGEIVKLDTFSDSERRVAEEARLELEIRLNRNNIDHEVVLLEADSEEALRRTHRRYFESLTELATPSSH
jgi:hypothetical protein